MIEILGFERSCDNFERNPKSRFIPSEQTNKIPAETCSCLISVNHNRLITYVTRLPEHHASRILKGESGMTSSTYNFFKGPCLEREGNFGILIFHQLFESS